VSDYGLSIEPAGEKTFGVCSDCGSATRSVWGYVSNPEGARAAYFIRWTDGHLERGAQLVISIGAWGEEAKPADRLCFAFECRMGTDRPGFMAVDAAALPWAEGDFLGVKLSREGALGHPVRDEVFGILDQLVEHDLRFRAFLVMRRD
jgi:hypothetical protein